MLRTYSLFQGEAVTNKITLSLPSHLRNQLETQCRAEWRELHKIDPNSDNASPFLTYDELSKTEEGKWHLTWLRLGFYVLNVIPGYPIQPYAKGVDISEYNAMLSRISARRYNTRGRRRQLMDRATNAVEYRKFRSWWISKRLAHELGAEFLEPCPYEPMTTEPTKSYTEMARHFEEWTGHKLPEALWSEIKKDEQERLSKLKIKKLAA